MPDWESPDSNQPGTALVQPALGFRPVNAERIQFGHLVHKAFLRRDRNHHCAVAQKDGLAQLKIPIPQRQSLPLERRQGELGSSEEIEQSSGID
jgi:hypothetical protein